MMRKAHVGPTAYINAQTGTLLDSGRMGYQLRRFLETAESYQPRRWAIENISCHRSHEKLNALLRDYSHSNGLPWSVDLKVPCWRPYPLYVNPSDREEMSCVYADLHRRYPEVFRPGLPEAGNG